MGVKSERKKLSFSLILWTGTLWVSWREGRVAASIHSHPSWQAELSFLIATVVALILFWDWDKGVDFLCSVES